MRLSLRQVLFTAHFEDWRLHCSIWQFVSGAERYAPGVRSFDALLSMFQHQQPARMLGLKYCVNITEYGSSWKVTPVFDLLFSLYSLIILLSTLPLLFPLIFLSSQTIIRKCASIKSSVGICHYNTNLLCHIDKLVQSLHGLCRHQL